jgi:Rho-binding antiterminator
VTRRSDYTPPSCGFHDELEAHAVRRDVVRIEFQDRDGAERTLVDTIADLWAEGGAEYLRTGDGTTIRLDRLKGIRRTG